MAQSASLELYIQAQDEATAVIERMTEQFDRMSTGIQLMTEQIDNAMTGLREMGQASNGVKEVADQAKIASENIANVGREARTASEGARMMGRGFGGAGMQLQFAGMQLTAFGYGVERVFSNAINKVTEFQTATRQTAGLVQNMTPGEIKGMQGWVNQASMKLPISQTNLMQAMYQAISDSFRSQSARRGLVSAAGELSVAGNAQLPEVKIMSRFMNAFHMQRNQKGFMSAASQLYGAVNLGQITLPELAQFGGKTYSTMQQAGLTSMGALSDLSVLSNVMPVAQASTTLARFFESFVKPTKAAQKAAANARKTVKGFNLHLNAGWVRTHGGNLGVLHQFALLNQANPQALAQIIGRYRGIRGITSLLAGGGSAAAQRQGQLESITKNHANLTRAYSQSMKTFGVQWQIFKNHLFKAYEVLASDVEPALQSVMVWVERGLNWFQNLNPTLQKTISLMAGVAGAVGLIGGPILMAVGGIGMLKMGLNELFAGGAAEGAAAGGLTAGLLAPFRLLMRTLKSIGSRLLALILWPFKQAGALIMSVFGDAIGSVVDILMGTLGVVADVFTGPVGWAALAAAAGVLIINHWQDIKKFLGVVWNGIVKLAGTVWSKLGPLLSKLWSWIKVEAGKVWGAISWEVGHAFSTAWTWVQTGWGKIVNYLESETPKVIGHIENWFYKLPGKIAKWLGKVYGKLSVEIPKWWKDVKKWLGKLPGKIMHWFHQTGKKMDKWKKDKHKELKAWANGLVKGFKTWLSNLPSTFHDVAKKAAKQFVNALKNIPSDLMNAWGGANSWFGQIMTNISKTAGSLANSFKMGKATGVNQGHGINSSGQVIGGKNATVNNNITVHLHGVTGADAQKLGQTAAQEIMKHVKANSNIVIAR